MNQFEKVCETCPLRTKVDVDHAGEWNSMGTAGLSATLYDGVYRHKVRLEPRSVYNSGTANAIQAEVQGNIEGCEGPDISWLQQKCGAGLASAWRRAEIVGTYEPTISSPEEIVPLLLNADYTDAIVPFDAPGYLVGDLKDFSELDCSFRSAFGNNGIRKLAKTVSGSHAKLLSHQAVMLDRTMWPSSEGEFRNLYRIRVAQGGPQFAFYSETARAWDSTNKDESANERLARVLDEPKDVRRARMDKIFAEGIYKYLFSDAEAMQQSDSLINAAEDAADKWHEWVGTEGFKKLFREQITPDTSETLEEETPQE